MVSTETLVPVSAAKSLMRFSTASFWLGTSCFFNQTVRVPPPPPASPPLAPPQAVKPSVTVVRHSAAATARPHRRYGRIGAPHRRDPHRSPVTASAERP